MERLLQCGLSRLFLCRSQTTIVPDHKYFHHESQYAVYEGYVLAVCIMEYVVLES